jgi:hypothetical protein
MRKLSATSAGLILFGLLLVMAARTFGPVRALENLVVDRLGDDGHAGVAEQNPMWNSRIALVSWQIDEETVLVSVHESRRRPSDKVIKTQSFGGVQAQLVPSIPPEEAWRFQCDLNSVLFDYGTMEIALLMTDQPEVAVPRAHSLLNCG